ncbi:MULTISPECIES: isoprenyl transferase [Megasphaera]|uniref:Isoprenyl transferase n=1 Tax=Megasphaera vaginalis (ex Srinivasan et al. 2021) TaxID=1111454 RepID=U7UG33_9FIRM|nr:MULTISPECIES: isoprenyl transferase [Megasphaera]ERT58392.1 di-trans,poly-cis-decaprenylcistransferase [Megasphaera vaginalis (ex Srinivasan et al. 2021)]
MIPKIFSKDRKTDGTANLDKANIPRHVAIIMDGNGRWAKRKGLPRSAGHYAGAKTLKRIVLAADELGIKVLSVYAFSTENWKRPQAEVDYIMELMHSYLSQNLLELKENNVRLRFIGDMSRLSDKLRAVFIRSENDMKDNTGLILNVAVNYGGRLEITQAARQLAADVEAGKLCAAAIREEDLAARLYTAPENDVDLLIRPGSDSRVSNFLLWQMAYAEFWFTPLSWPDFTKDTLIDAVLAYQGRERRFGGLK